MAFNVPQRTQLSSFVKNAWAPVVHIYIFVLRGKIRNKNKMHHGSDFKPTQIARQFNTLQFVPTYLKLSHATSHTGLTS